MGNVRAVSFSFTWGLIENYSSVDSVHIALRNCSEEVGGGEVIWDKCMYVILE